MVICNNSNRKLIQIHTEKHREPKEEPKEQSPERMGAQTSLALNVSSTQVSSLWERILSSSRAHTDARGQGIWPCDGHHYTCGCGDESFLKERTMDQPKHQLLIAHCSIHSHSSIKCFFTGISMATEAWEERYCHNNHYHLLVLWLCLYPSAEKFYCIHTMLSEGGDGSISLGSA